MAAPAEPAPAPKSIVIKIGTSSLLSEDGLHPKLSMIARVVEAAARLREAGHSVIIVTSGAVGFGCVRMKLESRPSSVIAKQALASIGQSALMRIYDEFFTQLGHTCAQVCHSSLPINHVSLFAWALEIPVFTREAIQEIRRFADSFASALHCLNVLLPARLLISCDFRYC